MESTAPSATPWHLWLFGIVALIFTCFGVYDYYMSQIGNREYIETAVAGMGIDVDTAVAYFSSFPLWMDFVWAIGVWGGLAAAVALLMRSRFAYPLFVVSLAALVISNAYGLINPLPGVRDPTAMYMMIAVIFVVMLGLTLYARRMVARGLLR